MPSERKRPWYLVLALLGALALGMTGACNGWAAWTLYREPVDVTLVGQGISDPARPLPRSSRGSKPTSAALDAAKPRGWPVAVATLLLGGAMVLFSMRALGGSGGARAALVQIVVAQAGVNAASYWLLRDVMDADTRWREASAGGRRARAHPRSLASGRDAACDDAEWCGRETPSGSCSARWGASSSSWR